MKFYRPLIWVCCAYGGGIGLVSVIEVPLMGLCLVIMGLLVMLGVFFQREKISCIVLVFIFLGIGHLHMKAVQLLEKKDIAYVARFYRGKALMLKGEVVSDVQVKDFFKGKKLVFEIAIRNLHTKWGWRKHQGKILVNAFKEMDIAYGDDVLIEGKLHRPFNFSSETNFSYRDYLEHRGITNILSVAREARVEILDRRQGNPIKMLALRMHKRLKRVLAEALSPNEAGIMQAVLLGDRSHIPKHVRELFVQTGTAHVLAISGLHVGVVAALFMGGLRIIPIGRKLQLLSVIILLTGYAFLTGGRPSVIRATVVGIVFLMSFILERETDAMNTLSLAALIILLTNPRNLFDVGFQLSFTCVLAIILICPKLVKDRNPLYGPFNLYNNFVHFITQSLKVSVSVWLGAAGLVAYYFNIITPITIFANLIIIPLISVIVTLGFGLLLFGMIFPPLGVLFGLCIKVVLNSMVGIIFLLAKIPYAFIYIKNVTLWQTTSYYAMIFFLFLLLQRVYKR